MSSNRARLDRPGRDISVPYFRNGLEQLQQLTLLAAAVNYLTQHQGIDRTVKLSIRMSDAPRFAPRVAK